MVQNIQVVKPLCYQCKKPVDNLIWLNEITTQTKYAVASCHGDKEVVEVKEDFKKRIPIIERGILFVTTK